MTLKHHYNSKTVLTCEKKSIELFGFKISTQNRLWTSVRLEIRCHRPE